MAREVDYADGQRATWIELLRLAIRNLSDGEPDGARLILERAEAIQTLRHLCSVYGDNDWQDTEYLPDIIEKHLGRHLADTGGTGRK